MGLGRVMSHITLEEPTCRKKDMKPGCKEKGETRLRDGERKSRTQMTFLSIYSLSEDSSTNKFHSHMT